MKSQLLKFALAALMFALVSCASDSPDGDDLAMDSAQEAPADSGSAGTSMAPKQDTAAAESSPDDAFSLDENQKPAAQAAKSTDNDDLSLDEPSDKTANANPPAQTPPADNNDLSLDEPQKSTKAPEPAPSPAPEIAEMPAEKEAPAEKSSPAPTPVETPATPMSNNSNTQITDVKYKANDNGGTVIIEANAPLTYTTRKNSELHQLVIEVPNAILPHKLQRPLNTRDMQGSIGSIDPYQHSGSNVARFVIQLREGAPEPLVQPEGNSILIVSNPTATESVADLSSKEGPVNVDLNNSSILSSQSLSEFLSGNTKFYGKKISIEMTNMDVRDALRFITEESGVNMVITDEVKGNITLKLRQVPWDQALVMILRAKQLGYSRQGNILRITTQSQLRAEEEDATKSALAKRQTEPLKVRMFPVSYAQVADLEKRVAGFLTERGKVASDVRTNSLVVTDIEDNIQRIAKLIESLDTQPPQVMIEGKIVEATDTFSRSIGVSWNSSGTDLKVPGGGGPAGPVTLHPTTAFNAPTQDSSFALNLVMGTLDGLGSLSAQLQLGESDERVKVLASPRIATLSNEIANIDQTQELPVKTVTVTNGIAQNSFSYKQLKLSLEVTPQITADSSIIMKVHVLRQFPDAVNSDGSFGVQGREATTKILVKNAQTAVIGGIYTTDNRELETGVPYLREIPVLGALFRGSTTSKGRTELLIFLTPRIMAAMEGSKPTASAGGTM